MPRVFHRPPLALALLCCFSLAACKSSDYGGVNPRQPEVSSRPAVAVASDVGDWIRGKSNASSGRGVETQREDGSTDVELQQFPKFARKQKTPVWCWAACAEMIHAWNRIHVSQEAIAARVHGSGNIKTACYNEVMVALNPDLCENDAEKIAAALEQLRSFRLQFSAQSLVKAQLLRLGVNDDEIVDSLRAGQPLAVGLAGETDDDPGHVFAAYGARFRASATSGARDVADAVVRTGNNDGSVIATAKSALKKYDILSLSAVDPWTGESVTIAGDDYSNRFGFRISKPTARRILTEDNHVLQVFPGSHR
jgi:hypothetical protein